MMKKQFKRILAIALSLVLTMTFVSVSFAADTSSSDVLQFGSDGKFTIIQFTDCQDSAMTTQAMIDFMNDVLADVKPDLVIFTGDNVVQPGNMLNSIAIENIIQPLIDNGNIPYLYTFGNHDAENDTKAAMNYSYLHTGNCLNDTAASIFDAGNGCDATCSYPIMSSADATKTAFNLYMIDSNMYASSGYDTVHADQIAWYKEQSNALKAANGGTPVKSMVFQHIIVPEAYKLLNVATASSTSTKEYNGVTYELSLNPQYLISSDTQQQILQEWPCPPDAATVGDFSKDEYATMAAQGDVIGIATGHDHVNNFLANLHDGSGIDFIQTAGATYSSYGNDNVRGARVITLDEKTSTYTTYSKLATSYGYSKPDDSDAGDTSYVLEHLSGYFASLAKIIAAVMDRLIHAMDVVFPNGKLPSGRA